MFLAQGFAVMPLALLSYNLTFILILPFLSSPLLLTEPLTIELLSGAQRLGLRLAGPRGLGPKQQLWTLMLPVLIIALLHRLGYGSQVHHLRSAEVQPPPMREVATTWGLGIITTTVGRGGLRKLITMLRVGFKAPVHRGS
jgi:hypothetical protein